MSSADLSSLAIPDFPTQLKGGAIEVENAHLYRFSAQAMFAQHLEISRNKHERAVERCLASMQTKSPSQARNIFQARPQFISSDTSYRDPRA